MRLKKTSIPKEGYQARGEVERSEKPKFIMKVQTKPGISWAKGH